MVNAVKYWGRPTALRTGDRIGTVSIPLGVVGVPRGHREAEEARTEHTGDTTTPGLMASLLALVWTLESVTQIGKKGIYQRRIWGKCFDGNIGYLVKVMRKWWVLAKKDAYKQPALGSVCVSVGEKQVWKLSQQTRLSRKSSARQRLIQANHAANWLVS